MARLMQGLIRIYCLIGLLALSPITSYAKDKYVVALEADDVVSRVLFDAIESHFGVSIEYANYQSFSAILTAVEMGQADFAANVTYTDDRATRFDFSGPTNIEYTYLYSRENLTLEQVENIGVPEGTIYGDLVALNFPDIEQITYNGHEEARIILESGRVEGVIDAINQLKPMLLAGFDAQLLNHQISIKPVSLVVPKGRHSERLAEFEDYLHSGEVQKLLRESIRQYQFDIRQQALRQLVFDSGINYNRPLRVKLEYVGQYAQIDDNGGVSGISADIVMQSCDLLMLNCQIMNHKDETWEEMYHDLINQEIDILSPMVISESRKNIAYFSSPYYLPKGIMVKREGYKNGVYSNVSELIAERIGVVQDDFFQELLSGMLPQKTLNAYTNVDEQVKALLDGEVDYIALSKSSYNKVLRESDTLLPIVDDTLIGDYYTTQVAIGFPKNRTGEALAPLFTRAIKMLDTEKIIKNYDFQPDWKATLQTEKKFLRQTQILFVLVLGLLAIVAMYLHVQSNTDNLTRMKNRRALHRKYRNGVAANLTLIYLDVNDFKEINDSYGHEVGDQVLILIASKISHCWKGHSYRIGGDEFILVGDVTEQDLVHTTNTLSSIEYVAPEGDLSFDVSIAIGISYPRSMNESLQQVLNEADLAMYRNKSNKKRSNTLDIDNPDNVIRLA
ncbi:GGDEF domain-containing protein [Vibrio sonorensis]|uniref:GGDEF domain-containing protein n=1 Tax=Vibrio sonorensis TaxID=1004316 RepID=UPI000A059EE7|nr:GGDEF domain-containing protein [Vibrio sonorensis]